MTQTTDLAQQFLDELNTAGIQLRLTQTIAYNLGRAVHEQHWTIPQLVTECTRDLDTAANVGAVLTDRIRVAATVGPPKPKKPAISKGIPFCTDECRENAGWVLDHDGRPNHRCPCRTPATEATA